MLSTAADSDSLYFTAYDNVVGAHSHILQEKDGEKIHTEAAAALWSCNRDPHEQSAKFMHETLEGVHDDDDDDDCDIKIKINSISTAQDFQPSKNREEASTPTPRESEKLKCAFEIFPKFTPCKKDKNL